ncbi:hypothetical protein OIU79_014499, partial [Salix purpurea]
MKNLGRGRRGFDYVIVWVKRKEAFAYVGVLVAGLFRTLSVL